MSAGNWLFVLFVVAGAGNWLVEYRAQRGPGPRLLAFSAPSWMAWLCGNPLRDGTIDLERGVAQMTSLVFVFGAPLSLLLPVGNAWRAGLLFLVYALVAMPSFALVEWLRRLVEEEPGVAQPPSATRSQRMLGERLSK